LAGELAAVANEVAVAIRVAGEHQLMRMAVVPTSGREGRIRLGNGNFRAEDGAATTTEVAEVSRNVGATSPPGATVEASAVEATTAGATTTAVLLSILLLLCRGSRRGSLL